MTQPFANQFQIQWFGVTGKRYQAQMSTDLQAWADWSNPFDADDGSVVGDGAQIAIADTVAAGTPRRFYRVIVLPSYDSDGAGLDDYEEFLLGTNPLASDTDLDELTDLQEFSGFIINGIPVFTDPLSGDSDGDGVNDGPEIAAGGNPMDASDGFPTTPEQMQVKVRLQFRGTWPNYSGGSPPPIPAISLAIGTAASINQTIVNTASASPGTFYFGNTNNSTDKSIPRGVEYPFTLSFAGNPPFWPTVVGRAWGSPNNAANDRANLIVFQTGKGYYFTNDSGGIWAESEYSPMGNSTITSIPSQQLEARNFGTGKLWAVTFDLDIDSDNNKGSRPPDRSQAEEDLEEAQAKKISVNTNDDNANGVPDHSDTQVAGEKDLVPIILEGAPQSLEWSKIKVKFNSDSTGSEIRFWRLNTPGDSKDSPKQVQPGTIYTAAQLGLGEPNAAGNPQTQLKLYGEGLATTSGSRFLEAIFIFNDKEYFHDKVLLEVIPKVRLTVQGVTEVQKLTVGGLVVRNFDGNDAPRRKLTIDKIEPAATSGSAALILTTSSNKASVFTSSSGGTPLAFDGTDNRFTQAQLPIDLYVEGTTGSSTMRDVQFTATLDGAPSVTDQASFTVLWVEMTSRSADGEPVSPDNGGAAAYSAFTGSLTLGAKVKQSTAYFGTGIELIGTCQPSGFVPGQFGVTAFNHQRDLLTESFYVNSALVSHTSDPDDDSDPQVRDDDPQSGNSMGKMYDLDAPGYRDASLETSYSRRINFRQFVEVFDGGNTTRCSPNYSWFTRSSASASNTGNVTLSYVYAGDNVAGPGTTNLTLDLQ